MDKNGSSIDECPMVILHSDVSRGNLGTLRPKFRSHPAESGLVRWPLKSPAHVPLVLCYIATELNTTIGIIGISPIQMCHGFRSAIRCKLPKLKHDACGWLAAIQFQHWRAILESFCVSQGDVTMSSFSKRLNS